MPSNFLSVTDRGLAFALSKRWQVTEDLAISMGPELMPVLPVEAREIDYHLGWQQYSRGFTQPAVAADFADVQFVNPVGSNLIMKVEEIWFDSSAACALDFIRLGSAALADLANTFLLGTVRDTRQPQAVAAVARISSTATVAQLSQGGARFVLPATTSVKFPLVLPVLTPGSGFAFSSNVANQSLNGMFIWRERMLNEAESAT